jgi:phosphoglycerol transferase MdoB-like AlkP superfamily enzyme
MLRINAFFNTVPHVKALLQRMSITLFFFTITRIIFWLGNYSSFSGVSLSDFIAGLFFDLLTICIVFLPYAVLFLLPIPIRGYRVHSTFFKLLFHITNGVCIAFNLLDIEYFKFTNKRSTSDLFTVLGAGNDFAQLATTFVKDFWWVILLFIFIIGISEWLYRKTKFKAETLQNFTSSFWVRNSITFILFLFLQVFIGRGGFVIRPISTIHASKYTTSEKTALVLNTPFTLIKSIENEPLKLKDYLSKDAAKAIYSPIHKSTPQHIFDGKPNVMIIVLESFGNEFLNTTGGRESYAPFLDSLLKESMYFTNAISNGKKSIEGIPSIVASIPSLMDNPFIGSNYETNQIEGLPKILKKEGYSSYFFHGATNGSMKFDAFSAAAGFDAYYGRKEYNNDKHFDKTWGILDEYFEPWTAKKLTTLKQPFYANMFTLSSHHPYYIPPVHRSKMKKGPTPMYASINYGDYSLRQFFKEAKQQPWYKNTLFVFVADHTPASKDSYYVQRTGTYRIPIAFYDPMGRLKAQKKTEIINQIDIGPTVIDLLNLDIEYYSLGSSFYEDGHKFGISYLEGTHHYFADNYLIYWSNDKVHAVVNFKDENPRPIDSTKYLKSFLTKELPYLKAYIQRYNQDVIDNKMLIQR